VQRIGQKEVRTVEEIRENPGAETVYWIQEGRDFATRVWTKESEIERAAINLQTSLVRRLYVHNFRCLENFELKMSGRSSVLLIGRNGAGKTTVRFALEVFQKIARNTNRVGALVLPEDYPWRTPNHGGRIDVPMRFEIEVELNGRIFEYSVAFEFPEGFRELRVFQERVVVDGTPVFTRERAQVRIERFGQEASFLIDWHLVALPIVQLKAADDPLLILREWLANMIILNPIPSHIKGDSERDTLQPNPDVTNFASWFSGILADSPSAYTKIAEYLQQVMPDLKDIKNPMVGRESRSLLVQFSTPQGSLSLPLDVLSSCPTEKSVS
jgi:energy-coupling factor transporter ATP-binding protein EcfA2